MVSANVNEPSFIPIRTSQCGRICCGCLLHIQHITYVSDPFHSSGLPIPVAARSKAKVFGRSPAEIVGSNPTGGMDVSLFFCCECCVLSGRGLFDGLITRPEGFYRLWRVIKTMRKQVKINRSNRWATPKATIPLAKIKSE